MPCSSFFWISFNALYGRDSQEGDKEFKEYFDEILSDEGVKEHICDLFNNEISWEIRLLTKNRFIRRHFWEEGKIKNPGRKPNIVPDIITRKNIKKVLYDVFRCLRILRNQAMHGNSTWNSEVGRRQLCDGIKIMQPLLPIFIKMEKFNNNSHSDKKEIAISWLDRAQQVEKGLERIGKDISTQFIFLWIGFNAIYAGNPDENLLQEGEIENYFRNLLTCNEAKEQIYNIIDSDIVKEKIESLRKQPVISEEKKVPFPVWEIESTKDILCYVFQRLCPLRNRLVHGCELWDCELKKSRLANNTKIMHHLLPAFIEIMLKIPEKEWKQWGKIRFPRVLGVPIEGEPWEKRNF